MSLVSAVEFAVPEIKHQLPWSKAALSSWAKHVKVRWVSDSNLRIYLNILAASSAVQAMRLQELGPLPDQAERSWAEYLCRQYVLCRFCWRSH